jgi:hypothetical protein
MGLRNNINHIAVDTPNAKGWAPIFYKGHPVARIRLGTKDIAAMDQDAKAPWILECFPYPVCVICANHELVKQELGAPMACRHCLKVRLARTTYHNLGSAVLHVVRYVSAQEGAYATQYELKTLLKFLLGKMDEGEARMQFRLDWFTIRRATEAGLATTTNGRIEAPAEQVESAVQAQE